MTEGAQQNYTKVIGIIIAGIVLITIVFVVVKQGFPNPNDSETEIIYCGPNHTKPVVVFKNPTKAFPAFAQEYKANINASLDVIDTLQKSPAIKVNGQLGLETKVIELRERLNQESIRMESIMKSNFLAFNARPCDPIASKQYYDLLTLMAQKNEELEKLRLELTIHRPSAAARIEPGKAVLITDPAKIETTLDKFIASYQFEKS